MVKVVSKIVQVVLGVAFLGAGAQKLAGTDQMVDEFARFRYPQWFRVVTGAVEVGGALGLLLGTARPVLVPAAGLLLGATMGGAVITRARVGDPTASMLRPVVLMTVALSLAAARLGQLGGARTSTSEGS